RRRLESADVGVVAVQAPLLEPESIYRADALGDVRQLVAAGVNGNLVGNGDVAGCAQILELPQHHPQLAGGNVDGLVYERNSCRSKRCVLEDRRQRMGDWMTQQHQTSRKSGHNSLSYQGGRKASPIRAPARR